MILPFTKMHGLGNDFVVLDGINHEIKLSAQTIRRIADRRFGIGCDQLLLVEPAHSNDADFRYRIFNADGDEVEQCGNGVRCFARFVLEQGLTDKHQIRVETLGGLVIPEILDNGHVRVVMGVPNFDPQSLPFKQSQRQALYELPLQRDGIQVGAVSMGNPHAVYQVDDIHTAAVNEIGPQVESHMLFPKRVNAGFMQVLNRQAIQLRVYERGAGETLACGTGACAAVAVGRLWGELDESVIVSLPGGDLIIEWQGEGQTLFMTGDARTVFEGKIDLATLD